MRKLISFMLLASAATAPALAAPRDRDDREQARAERQQAREDARPQRAEREARPERPQRDFDVQRAAPARAQFDAAARARAEAPQRDLDQIRAVREARANALRDARRPDRVQPGRPMAQRPDRFGGPQVDRQTPRERIAERMAERRAARPAPVISPVPRPGTQPPPPTSYRPSPAPNWNSNWRYDRRYDWNDYRRRHRSLFNLGFYYDPFGWGYQPYQIGWRMWPSYYSSSYWLNDPWQYRLPYAPPGYRWVRYWNDAVLVDTWSGQVVDVIYSFFW